MIYWHDKLYFGEKTKEKFGHIRTRLEDEKPVAGLYVITISSNPVEQLDIYSADMFISSLVYNPAPIVTGLAFGQRAAQELVALMAFDDFEENGKVDLREFFKTCDN